MTDFKQNESIPTAQQIESIDAIMSQELRSEFFNQSCFKDTVIHRVFELRIVELAQSKSAIFRDEFVRGIAWLCFKYTGYLSTEIVAKLELIPLFKKYSTEFDTELTFEDAANFGHRYFPSDKFEMIGGDY